MASYLYSITGSTASGSVAPQLLSYEIEDLSLGSATFQYVDVAIPNPDDLKIFFSGTLDAGDKTTLDNTVAAHDGTSEANDGDLVLQTRKPNVNDDKTGGCVIGTRWINTNNDKHWICMDPTIGAAVWKRQTNSDSGDSENDAVANCLRTATAIISISGSAAPSAGQVLKADSSTVASWQNEITGATGPQGPSGSQGPVGPQGPSGSISHQIVSSTSTTSTTSNSFVLINSMTITPASGTYIVTFSTSGKHSDATLDAEYTIYSGGAEILNSTRKFGWNGGAHANELEISMHTQAIVSVNGSQAIEARWHNGSGGTFTCNARNLIIMKV